MDLISVCIVIIYKANKRTGLDGTGQTEGRMPTTQRYSRLITPYHKEFPFNSTSRCRSTPRFVIHADSALQASAALALRENKKKPCMMYIRTVRRFPVMNIPIMLLSVPFPFPFLFYFFPSPIMQQHYRLTKSPWSSSARAQGCSSVSAPRFPSRCPSPPPQTRYFVSSSPASRPSQD